MEPTCPKRHRQLGSASVGNEYGHVPGHTYHDVDVLISISAANNKIRCLVRESGGSSQGRYDEEHGHTQVIGRGDSIREAVGDARQRALNADIERSYLEQALSLAEDEAEEAE